jgi:hypothetical protein
MKRGLLLILVFLFSFSTAVSAEDSANLHIGFNEVSANFSIVNYENQVISLASVELPVGYPDLVVKPNQTPTAVITLSPEQDLDTTTSITWSTSQSTDPDGTITKAEWKVDGIIVSAPPTTLQEGTHTIELRVQDNKDAWSLVVSKSLSVIKINLTPKVFAFTGNYQTFTAPATKTYKLEVWGAQGGFGVSSTGYSLDTGGKGGYAYGNIALTKGEVLYLYVGGLGQSANGSGALGGWNGGGRAQWYGNYGGGGGGGGGTDIRRNGQTLNHRIIVGGGGGGGQNYSNYGGGGGLTGGIGTRGYGYDLARGGTQTAGGTQDYYLHGENGSFGLGGSTTPSMTDHPSFGGGGGGGWYGGAGRNDTPGGGGSSYLGTLANAGATSDARSGVGAVTITIVP